VVDAHADPCGVRREVVDPVGNRLAEIFVDEVVHADRDGLSGRLPFSASVLEIADEFLLLRVDGDHGSSACMVLLDSLVDELELRVAIRVRGAFGGLVGCLEAVTRGVQQLPDLLRTDAKPLREKLAGEFSCALGRPTKRRLRVSTRHGVDERFQRLDQMRARLLQPRPSSPWASNVDHVLDARPGAKLVASPADRRARHSRRPLHRRDSPVPVRVSLRPRPQAFQPLVHHRLKRLELRANLPF